MRRCLVALVLAVPEGTPADRRSLRVDAFLKSLRATASWSSIVARHYGSSAFEAIAHARLNE